MGITELFAVIRMRWRVISSVVVVCIGLAVGVSVLQTPLYASSTQLFVSTATDGGADIYQGSLYSVQRVTSYVQLARSLKIAQSVVSQLDLDLAPSQLQSKVSAAVVPNTTVLQVTVSDPSPRRAQQLDKGYADALKAAINDLETPDTTHTSLVKVAVIDEANLPASPYSPNYVLRTLLAVFLGLILGLAMAIVRHLLDNKVRDPKQAADQIEVPLLSVVGKLDQRRSDGVRADVTEAFRLLRTNLVFAEAGRSLRVYVVASPAPGDGKTSIACELARSLAISGRRVLLVDADLRKPTVDQRTGLDGSVGLTSVMIGAVSLRDAVQRLESWKLDVLTSGRLPPNPSELLEAAIEPVFQAARAEYDVVIVDAAPLLPVTDTAVLGRHADGVILVAKHGTTTRRQLTLARSRLTAVSVHVVGLVLNFAPVATTSEYGYGYGYAYGYGHSEGRRRWSRSRATRVPPADLDSDGHAPPADAAREEPSQVSGHHPD